CKTAGIRVKCGKWFVVKSLGFSAFFATRSPEWGSGGRWFESSRPDIEGRLSADDSRPLLLPPHDLTAPPLPWSVGPLSLSGLSADASVCTSLHRVGANPGANFPASPSVPVARAASLAP